MTNPLLDAFSSRQPQPSQPQGIFGMINQVRNSQDPNAAMQQLIQQNPNFQNVMNYIQANGGDAKTAFYNMAAQKGIDPNSILRYLR